MPALEIRPAIPKELRSVLRLILAAHDRTAAEVERQVTGFIQYARELALDLRGQWVALLDGRIVAACACIESPGRTAMLLLPPAGVSGRHGEAVSALVFRVLESERDRNVHLLQCLLELPDAANPRLLAGAGFKELATLLYLEWTAAEQRGDVCVTPPPDLTGGAVEWASYSPECHADFTELIAATYENSLDCRGLSGLRDIEDVVAGHKASGRFDPHRWRLLRCNGESVGCILLAENPVRSALELVYIGVRPRFRGQGLGKILLAAGLALAVAEGFEAVTLAVDSANVPALALYRAFGFHQTHARAAFIRCPI